MNFMEILAEICTNGLYKTRAPAAQKYRNDTFSASTPKKLEGQLQKTREHSIRFLISRHLVEHSHFFRDSKERRPTKTKTDELGALHMKQSANHIPQRILQLLRTKPTNESLSSRVQIQE